jgi:hypothetical protein
MPEGPLGGPRPLAEPTLKLVIEVEDLSDVNVSAVQSEASEIHRESSQPYGARLGQSKVSADTEHSAIVVETPVTQFVPGYLEDIEGTLKYIIEELAGGKVTDQMLVVVE